MKTELNEEQTKADKHLIENVEEAKEDFNKAVDLYRSYVGKSETREERERRIMNFRCGGRCSW